jgi:hypothetical protein
LKNVNRNYFFYTQIHKIYLLCRYRIIKPFLSLKDLQKYSLHAMTFIS